MATTQGRVTFVAENLAEFNDLEARAEAGPKFRLHSAKALTRTLVIDIDP